MAAPIDSLFAENSIVQWDADNMLPKLKLGEEGPTKINTVISCKDEHIVYNRQ